MKNKHRVIMSVVIAMFLNITSVLMITIYCANA